MFRFLWSSELEVMFRVKCNRNKRAKEREERDTSNLSWLFPQSGSSPVPLSLTRDFSLYSLCSFLSVVLEF